MLFEWGCNVDPGCSPQSGASFFFATDTLIFSPITVFFLKKIRTLILSVSVSGCARHSTQTSAQAVFGVRSRAIYNAWLMLIFHRGKRYIPTYPAMWDTVRIKTLSRQTTRSASFAIDNFYSGYFYHSVHIIEFDIQSPEYGLRAADPRQSDQGAHAR